MVFGLGVARCRSEEAVAELEEARDELLAHGDLEKAAEAEAMASFLGVASETSLARLEEARQLVRDRPPSRSKALVLAQLAYRSASVRDPAWEMYANEALAIAESLRLDDLQVSVLVTIGTARGILGQPGNVDALEEAVKVADSIDSVEGLRARINLAAQVQVEGELERCFGIQARARSDAERFGERGAVRHLRSERVWEHYWQGLWDESSREADAFLAEVEAGEPHPAGEFACRHARAHIRLARGDPAGAIADGEQAVRVARDWPVWDTLATALAAFACVLLAVGRTSEAAASLAEVRELGLSWAYAAPDVAVVLVGLGREQEVSIDELFPQRSLWAEAAQAFCAHDYVGAADLYARIGSLPDEADARLRSGHDEQVRRALDFYRSVGASRCVQESEALLARTV